ncbi:MAG TPA: methyltransferase [Candidatus Cloacimonadota bacterium]|nr:methyltransferase [Candidatus Cloacimonadota bacterium]
MPGPYAGALALKSGFLRAIRLPVNDLIIYQDSRFQPVTHASVFLQEETLHLYNKPGLKVLELGSGSGIVSIMLALHRPDWIITGLEIQEQEVILAQDNAKLCNVKVDFIQADLRAWVSDQDFDLIISNPPWLPVGSGLSSPLESRRIGREELSCSMDDLITSIQRLSTADTETLLIYPRDRESEFCSKLQKTSLDTIQVLHSSDFKRYFISQIRKIKE